MSRIILFFGRNPSIMALVKIQVIAAGYLAEGFMDDDELYKRLEKPDIALLILGGGVEDGPRESLRNLCQSKGIRLLEHFGGPDQLRDNMRAALI